jgi:hypothetical protein
MYGERVNQLDFRFSKVIRFNQSRTSLNFDVFNMLNSSAVLTQNNSYTGPWQTPLSILRHGSSSSACSSTSRRHSGEPGRGPGSHATRVRAGRRAYDVDCCSRGTGGAQSQMKNIDRRSFLSVSTGTLAAAALVGGRFREVLAQGSPGGRVDRGGP